MINPDDWPLLQRPSNLSDEAAAQIADYLMELALSFENTHFSQIRRHHQNMRPPSTYDPNQLELFHPGF